MLTLPTSLGITWGDLADGFENSPIEFTAYDLGFGVASELDDVFGTVDDPTLLMRVEGVVSTTCEWVAEAKAARKAGGGAAGGQRGGVSQLGIPQDARILGGSTGAN